MNEHNPNIASEAQPTAPKLKAERRGAVQVFALARPVALNAFDDEMCGVMLKTIPVVARNADIYINALVSESAKAFCAGGDVIALARQAKSDIEAAKTFLRNEYALDWLLECYSKPMVSFVDGICMGSGVGLSIYNTHRIAGANFKWAMPEVKIGFFPDVGVAHALARMPWPVGLYLGLTGRSVGRQDARWLKLATHCIGAEHFSSIIEKLSDAQTVDPLLDGLNESQPSGPIQNEFGMIRDHFSGASITEIFASLDRAKGSSAEWAGKVAAEMRSVAPMSLAITDRHIRSAASFDIRTTLIQDFRIAARRLADTDFHEGVRAALVDKDGRPDWQPRKVDEIDDAKLASYFAPLADDLTLPSREDMQQSRV